MNSILTVLLLVGFVAMVTSDCDTRKCLTIMSKVDMENPGKNCPEMTDAIACLQNVVDTCSLVDKSIQSSLDSARKTLSDYCSSGEKVAINVMMISVFAIFAAIFNRF